MRALPASATTAMPPTSRATGDPEVEWVSDEAGAASTMWSLDVGVWVPGGCLSWGDGAPVAAGDPVEVVAVLLDGVVV
jgi:hypothetical protein